VLANQISFLENYSYEQQHKNEIFKKKWEQHKEVEPERWYNVRADCGREDKLTERNMSTIMDILVSSGAGRRSPVWQERPKVSTTLRSIVGILSPTKK